MVFSYVITTNIGKVRLLISDSDVTSFHFTDDEIDAFLTMANSSLLLAASYALESWASAVSGNMKTEKIGDYSYGKDEAATKTALAKKYREEDASNPYLTWAEMDLTGGSSITAEED